MKCWQCGSPYPEAHEEGCEFAALLAEFELTVNTDPGPIPLEKFTAAMEALRQRTYEEEA